MALHASLAQQALLSPLPVLVLRCCPWKLSLDPTSNETEGHVAVAEEEEEFYRLLLQLLSYRTILAVERQTWCGRAPT